MSALEIGPEPPGRTPSSAHLRRAERRYRDAAWNSLPEQVLVRRCGRNPIVLTAPHAGVQTRNGWPKPADAGTGGLAEVIAEAVGGTFITVAGIQHGDPNWDIPEGDFKAALRQTVAGRRVTVLDLHAMRNDRDIDICIGTGRAGDGTTRALAAALAAMARHHGLRVQIDDPFSARNPGTMTSFAQRLDQRALQIEINSGLINAAEHNPRTAALLHWLTAAARAATRAADIPPTATGGDQPSAA